MERPRRTGRRARVELLLAVLTVGRMGCVLEKRAAAHWLVVRGAYEEGELGTQAEIERRLHPAAVRAIFDQDGTLERWDAMSPPQKHEADEFALSDDVKAKTDDAQRFVVAGVDLEECE